MGIRFANSALRSAIAVLGLRRPTGPSNSRGVQIRRWPRIRQGPHRGDLGCLWWSRRDLNPRPCACKAPALPLRHSTIMHWHLPTTWGKPQSTAAESRGNCAVRAQSQGATTRRTGALIAVQGSGETLSAWCWGRGTGLPESIVLRALHVRRALGGGCSCGGARGVPL